MRAEQISVFLENKAGRLAEVAAILAEADVNIRALAPSYSLGTAHLSTSCHSAGSHKQTGGCLGAAGKVKVQIGGGYRTHPVNGLTTALAILPSAQGPGAQGDQRPMGGT